MAIISKKEVEHLAELARIEITGEMGNVKSEIDEREKIAGDLEKILKYFEELKEVDTEGVRPMDGGMSEENVMRDDSNGMGVMSNETSNEGRVMSKEDGNVFRDAFPEEKDGFLKVPPVFNDENLESRK